MPGQRLLAIARLWLPREYVALVLEPLVADWHGELRLARWPDDSVINARARLSLVIALLLLVGRHARHQLVRPPAVRETIVMFALAALECTGLLACLWLLDIPVQSSTLASLTLVTWACRLWPPYRPAREHAVATFLQLSAALVAALLTLSGPISALVVIPLVPLTLGSTLRHWDAEGHEELSATFSPRRLAWIAAPLAGVVLLNALLDVGAWSDTTTLTLYAAWGCWGLLVGVVDATTDGQASRQIQPQVRR